jgi:hypothetical protein
MFRRAIILLSSILLVAAPVLAQQPNAGLEGFVQANTLPPGEQIPAAPLLIGSYGFFLVLMMFYLWTIWRRIGKVEHEMQELGRRQGAIKR